MSTASKPKVIQTLIFSDLDGTLLDHYTYKFEKAEPSLTKLKSLGIPVILNTSKTFAETVPLRAQLSIASPFIIENGAAVYIPKSEFLEAPADVKSVGEYWVKEFTSTREHFLDLLEHQASEFTSYFQHFSSMSLIKLSQLTGLTIQQATQAKARKYGEPVHWLGNDENKKQFIAHMENLGVHVTQGGRFIHISGHCNKGQALAWLTQQYQNIQPEHVITTIALGDGDNDTEMLEQADIGVQIRSPVHRFPVINRTENMIRTNEYGPGGWSEALQTILFNESASGSASLTSLNKEVNYG